MNSIHYSQINTKSRQMLKMAGIDDTTIDSCLEKIWETPEMLLNTKLIKKGVLRETYSEMRVSRSDGITTITLLE